MISPALAHGSVGVETSVGFGPLIFLAVGFAVVVVLLAEKKWRKRKQKRADIGR
ncbi:MAG: hypothetical protein IIB65_01840 [Proteobacteria bacterium]|nr:hypothetical protein [Pseudomonadota bacterium]